MQVSIERAMLHWVPRDDGQPVEKAVVLTDSEAPLESDQKTFLEKKVQGSLANDFSFGAVLDSDSDSPVPANVVEFLANPTSERLIVFSQDWAHHLYACHHANSPDGLLMVAQCWVDENDLAVAIVKLEQEEGVRAERKTLEDGRVEYEPLRDVGEPVYADRVLRCQP